MAPPSWFISLLNVPPKKNADHERHNILFDNDRRFTVLARDEFQRKQKLLATTCNEDEISCYLKNFRIVPSVSSPHWLEDLRGTWCTDFGSNKNLGDTRLALRPLERKEVASAIHLQDVSGIYGRFDEGTCFFLRSLRGLKILYDFLIISRQICCDLQSLLLLI